MSADRHFEAADAERAALRAAVAAVDHYVTLLPSAQPGGDQGLTASWAMLVKLLALGNAPQLRDCPRCGHVGMRDATRCGHCWVQLATLAPGVDERQVAGGAADS